MPGEISILDVKKDAKHIYVINNTKTDISITVRDDDGVSRLIRILRASIPQDVAEVVTPAMLKKASSFKRAISSGYISIISDIEAQKMLSTPEAKRELASIRKKLSRIPQELMVNTEETTAIESVSGTVSDNTIRAEVKDVALDEEETADDKFARLLMLNKEDPLTDNEKTWLISRLPERFSEIIKWLNS